MVGAFDSLALSLCDLRIDSISTLKSPLTLAFKHCICGTGCVQISCFRGAYGVVNMDWDTEKVRNMRSQGNIDNSITQTREVMGH